MFPHTNIPSEREGISLLELNVRVKEAISRSFSGTCWLRAETSDVRVNASSGHCYLEFIEKHPTNGQLIAKARGTIWGATFRVLKAQFESATGHVFTSGLKVMVRVTVDFHELYGFNLTVQEIDPAYTVGDMVRKRMEIISQLQKDGVFNLNKELTIPTLPQRIAIITSATAAGYEDFFNQLKHNKGGYPFYVKLFPALMQGEKTEESVINALDRIYACKDCFDVVVIIRGGGATSDLNSFDSYPLAYNCAQFPLPILSGIGHERDDTVVDMVANTRLKTPTAVAEFLIGRMDTAAQHLQQLQQAVTLLSTQILMRKNTYLQAMGNKLPTLVHHRIERSRTLLHSLSGKLSVAVVGTIARRQTLVDTLRHRLAATTTARLQEEKRYLELTGQYLQLASPEYILKRGYSLALKEGKIVKSASQLHPGELLTTRFADGEAVSVIDTVQLNKEA